MTSDEIEHKYIEREIDKNLWDVARQWVRADHQILWLSLVSAPGRGNTSLLERLNHVASKNANFEAGIKTVFVGADDADVYGPPRRRGPLARTFQRMITEGGMPRLHQAWRRIRKSGGKGAVLTVVIVLASILLGCFLKGLEQYITSPDTSSVSFGRWWGIFFLEFLPKNWRRFPLWFGIATVGTLPLSLMTLYLTRNRLYPKYEPEATGEYGESPQVRTTADLAEALWDICDPWRGLMLLVDDAHRLSEVEVDFLLNLFQPSEKLNSLHDFNREKSILIVTVDYEGNDWRSQFPEDTKANYKALTVPEFELVELRDILNVHSDKSDRTLTERKKQQLVGQAKHNVKSLFERHQEEMVEQVRREFLQKQKDDISSTFGPDEVMAYQAVRLEPWIKKSEMLDWLDSLSSSGYLSMFGLKAPQRSQDMVKDFAKSSLVRASGSEVYHLDLQRCGALYRWLQKESPLLVGQAHYHWCWNTWKKFSTKPVTQDKVSELTEAERHEIKVAAWHAAQIGELEKLRVPTDVLEQANTVSPYERRQRGYDVAEALLAAAEIWRSEGNLTETDDLIQDALDWLRGPMDERQQELLQRAANQHWQDYWLSADQTTREQLRSLAEDFPALTSRPFWVVHQRFEELLQACESLSTVPTGAEMSDPGVVNLHMLTETLLEIRQTHGFTASALRDPSLIVRVPATVQENTLAESYLRQMHVAAATEREDWQAVTHALAQWRKRLVQMEVYPGGVGDVALHCYNVARYWHLLAEAWQVGHATLDSATTEERVGVQKQLTDMMRAASLERPPEHISVREFLWQQAKLEYERASRIAALLSWRAFMMEVCFQLGVLLERHTPDERRTDAPPWWRGWDNLFSQCLEFEREQGWIMQTPAIHRIRWKFFEHENREISVEDAYNTFLAVKRAHYPNRVILNFHRQVSSLLNDYGDTDEDRKRTAELHTMWARELAELPEAASFRRFDNLQHEKADAFLFAAQARRLLGELETADSLLDEGFKLLDQARPLDGSSTEDEKVRDLRISLSLQRAWVREEQGQTDEYHSLLREIWGILRPDDVAASNVLGSLISVEARDALLTDLWPIDRSPVYKDPNNDAMSLPSSWFEGHEPLRIENRFEFRFHQLLYLATSEAFPSAAALKLIAAYVRWRGMNRYGEVALQSTQRGLQYKLTEETKTLVIYLLEAVRFYFAEVEKVDRHELEALRLLMNYKPDSMEYRMDYIKVLLEYKYLLEHELLVRKEEEEQNWYAMAERVHDYLGVLVDSDLYTNQVALRFRQSGRPVEAIQEMLKQKIAALREGRASYAGGDFGAGAQGLRPVLPDKGAPWVFRQDLEVLNLWLLCAKHLETFDPDEVKERAVQLRDFALEYVRQFSKVIKEVQVQHLALELLDGLQKSEKAIGEPSSPARALVRSP